MTTQVYREVTRRNTEQLPIINCDAKLCYETDNIDSSKLISEATSKATKSPVIAFEASNDDKIS